MAKKSEARWTRPVIKHGKLTKYNYIVQYPEYLVLGKNFDVGTFTYINSRYGVEIGDYVQIGSHCAIYSHSTIDGKKGKVVLQKNCKIGTHSTVMPGITVGQNSIVGAHSFVNTNIPKDEVWAGVPAKFLRKIKKH